MDTRYTVEELLLDETFLDYCTDKNSIHKNKWEQIAMQYPAELKVIDEAKKMFLLLNPGLSKEEIAAEVRKVREIILSRKKTEFSIPTADIPVTEYLYVDTEGELRGRRIKRMLAYGLIVAALSTGLIYAVTSGKNSSGENGLAKMTNYQSPGTERRRVALPDGSEVILNANSSISISDTYNKEDREIQLSGDAFFKVIKDTGKPFIVVTPNFSTTVMGTSFYVHARTKNNDHSVELLEGKVKMLATQADSKPILLSPGERAQWDRGQSSFIKYQFDTLGLKQWVSGIISFNKTPVDQVIQKLERWYAVEISDERKNRNNLAITGDYVNVPLDDVLKVICFTLSCEYNYSGDKIIIQ